MTAPSTPHSGPIALVTGAGSGIGLETARVLANAGYTVVLAGRSADRLRSASETVARSLVRPCDVGDLAACEGLVRDVERTIGPLDVLINNAGSTPMKPIEEHTTAEIESIFRVNAIGPCVLAVAALPGMLARQRGCIVNVSSMATSDPFPGLGPYASAKASLNLLTRAIHNEHHSHGVRCFCVAPGAVETPLLRSIVPTSLLPSARTLAPAAVAQVVADCVLGRRENDRGTTIFLPSP